MIHILSSILSFWISLKFGKAIDRLAREVFFDLKNDPKFLNIKPEIFRDILNPTILNIKNNKIIIINSKVYLINFINFCFN